MTQPEPVFRTKAAEEFAVAFKAVLLDDNGNHRPFGEAIRLALELSPTSGDSNVLAEVVAWGLALDRADREGRHLARLREMIEDLDGSIGLPLWVRDHLNEMDQEGGKPA